MSYAESLLATYPSSYGPSDLLSDDLIQRTNYDTIYPSSVPYMTSGRLLSDDLAFNQLNYDSKPYRPSLYPLPNSTSVYPAKKNSKQFATTNQRKAAPPPLDSFVSMNDITEYSDSLATASNTNTASSVARSFNGPTNIPPNYNRLSNYDNDTPPVQTSWSPPKPKQKGPTNNIKGKPITNSKTSTIAHKKLSGNESDDDITPVPSPKPTGQSTKKPIDLANNAAALVEIDRQSPSVDVQAWVNETEKGSPFDEKVAEQAWSMKIGQLHQAQIQREKEKTKSSRALPLPPKKVDNKPITSKSKSLVDSKSRETTHKATSDSYFDSLFDGDYFRPQPHLVSDYSMNLSLQQTTGKKSKPTTTSFTHSNATSITKNPKHVPPPRKGPRYEPPTPKRPQATITTTSWRKQWPKEYHFDSLYPYYSNNEITHRDFFHKDTDERFREALQKLRAERAERAEHQQKEINEKAAKRLHYGDYVRHSTKDALLQNAVKPSPWSDFMDMKKGNLYSLSKEEKKQLYNQSRSYGERIRYRNFAIQYANETSRSQRHSVPLIEDVQDIGANAATPRQTVSKSVSRTSKRPDSGSTTKTRAKKPGARTGNGPTDNQSNRANVSFNRSNNNNTNNRPSDDEYENLSETDTFRQQGPKAKQKNVRIAKYDSSGQTTNRNDDDDNYTNYDQGNLWTTNLTNNNEDLYTVREEKTLESFEDTRHKKH